MKELIPLDELIAVGLYNERGHLRFFKHPLLFPYRDHEGNVVYFQARAIEEGITPKFFNLPGEVPFPFNLKVLNNEPGIIYLCESVIDALTLVEKGFEAVGVAGAKSFRESWVDYFINKKVYLVFDADVAGRAGAEKVSTMLKQKDIYVSQMQLPEGMDVNEWFLS